MREVRILTLPLDPQTNLFDDAPLREWLATREVLRTVPQFFERDGRPYWTVFVEARPLQGADAWTRPAPGSAHRAAPAEEPAQRQRDAEKQAFLRLLSELDETERARYERLLSWRLDTARSEGIPAYVRAAIVLTDGADNSSDLTASAVIDRAQALGVPVYAIGWGWTRHRGGGGSSRWWPH